jgi:heptosyltransferase-2
MLLSPADFRYRRNYVAALASEIAAPALRGLARIGGGPTTDPRSWRRVLVLGKNHIGDVLWRTSSLVHLSRALPGCRFDHLCGSPSAEVLETNPYVDAVLHTSPGHRWYASGRALRALSAAAYDAAICTSQLRYHAELLLATRLGIPNRVGFVHKGLSGLVTHPVPIRRPMAFAAYFRAMVAQLGGVAPDWDLTPEIFTTGADEETAAGVWHELGLDDAPLVIACTLTTRQPARVWPPEGFLYTLGLLARRHEIVAVFCGAPEDAPFLARVAASSPVPSRVVAGRLRLREFAAFLRRCSLLLTSDSGPRHIGNAIGVPVAFVRNLAVTRGETGVYCANETDLAPDGEELSLSEQEKVLQALRPEEVAARLLPLLDRGPREEAVRAAGD